VSVYIVATVIFFTGCGTVKNSDRILADAVSASSTLAAYYDDLAVIALDSWQNQGVYNALLNIPPPSGSEYNERLQDFRRRGDLAHALVLVYQHLQTLHDPKGLASVTTAGQNLGQAIRGISRIPGAANIPTDELGSAAAAVANLRRERDLKRALNSVIIVNKNLLTLFGAEERIYLNIQSDRADTAEHLLELLAQKKLVNPGSLVPGLRIGIAVSAANDEPAAAAGLAIAKITAEREKLAWACATQQADSMLTALSGLGDAIKSGATSDLNSIEESTARANTCLKEHDSITTPGKQ
jgi:hypothetical protein